MRMEVALEYLRNGHRIYREKTPEDYLEGNQKNIYGSYYLTIYDLLADDWQVVDFEGEIKS